MGSGSGSGRGAACSGAQCALGCGEGRRGRLLPHRARVARGRRRVAGRAGGQWAVLSYLYARKQPGAGAPPTPVGSPPLIGSSWATANGGRHKAMRPGRGVAEWHMLPSWNSLHTLLVARAVLLWHGASYPVLRCSSLARHPDLGLPTVSCARRPLFWYPIPVRIGSPTGDAWLTCQCASQSACSAFHNIRRLSLPSRVGEGTSHCAICWLRLL